MNIESGELREIRELREERVKHPIEKIRSSQRHSHKQFRPTVVLSAAALLLGLGLIFLLLQMNEKYEIREKQASNHIDKLTALVGLIAERLDDNRQRVGVLTGDVELVQKRVGVTQSEIKKARAAAEEIKREQEQDVRALTDQIVSKADSQQVVNLEEKTGTKFQEVDEQITGVREEVQTSRQELEKTWQELAAIGVRVTEQGRLVATNLDALEELKQQGERDYLQFDARKKQNINVAGITIQLRKADYKKHRADLRFFYDDKQFDKKEVYTNTPLFFYVGRERIQYELVINEVKKDQIVGYISIPIGSFSTSLELKRSSD